MRILILVLGQFAGAASVLFIKASTLPSARLAAFRLLLAALVLFPLYKKERRLIAPELRPDFKTVFRRALVPGLLLGAHLTTWNMGARLTTAANATMIVNLVPVAMPFVAWFFAKERPGKWELMGSLSAVGGLAVLSFGSLSLGSVTWVGDVVCFVSMVLVASYMAFARRNRDLGLWGYVFPLYLVAGTAALAFDLVSGSSWSQGWTMQNLVSVLGLALVCTVVGHTISNWAMKHFFAQVVSIFTVTQFVWAGLFAFLIYREVPDALFYSSLVPVLAGTLLTLIPQFRKRVLKNKASI